MADEFSWPHGRQGTSGGGGTSGQDQYSFETDSTYPPEIVNPDAAMQARLVVEWGAVHMGFVDYDIDAEKGDQYWTTWKDDDSLRRDRRLSIRGRLLIESADGKNRRPIDWLQGVRVIVSRRPDTKHDWSSRQEMHEAVCGDAVVWKKGEFLAMLSPGEVHRPVGKEATFQVGLSLAKRDGNKITWKNTVGVLPQSVAMVKIPGPPAIPETLRIINGAPSYQQNDFNPAKLSRAVNHLIPMGKKKAILALRTFLAMARDSHETARIEENIDTSDRTCVFLIVRLLFEPFETTKKLPEILTVPFAPIPADNDKKLWPLYPVHIQDGVPFFMVWDGGLGGEPDQPERHVDWAEKEGKIRKMPIRPADNPMLAAERLAGLPQTNRLYADEADPSDASNLLYQQAWNSTEDINPKSPKPKPVHPANTFEEPDWPARLKAARKLKIHWNEAENRYVVE